MINFFAVYNMGSNYDFQLLCLNSATDSNADPAIIEYNLPYPIKLQNYDVAIATLFMYYSWFNITAAYGNNVLQYIYNGSTYQILFPDGFYQASDISGFIQLVMQQNGHYLVDNNGSNVYFISLQVNQTYYRYTLTCTIVPSVLPTGWTNPHSMTLTGQTMQLIVPPDGTSPYPMSKTIGYAANTYPTNPASSTYQSNGTQSPQISPVSSINVSTNMVNSSYFNTDTGVIASFTPVNTTFGAQISYEPRQLLFFQAVDSQLSKISITLTDQLNRKLQLRDDAVIANIYLRRRK